MKVDGMGKKKIGHWISNLLMFYFLQIQQSYYCNFLTCSKLAFLFPLS